MGLFELFNKEVACEKCGELLPKKLIGVMDSTRQGRRKDGQELKLCNKCMLDTLFTYLRNLQNKAIIIYPSSKYNAYAFYQFHELRTISEHSIHRKSDVELIDNMRELLPPKEAKCNRCNNDAHFTWCSIEIFKNADPYSWKVNMENNYESQYLCKDCLIKAFNQKVEEKNILFNTIIPPISGEGFCTPWDV